jgi:hypothetical protein
MALMVEATASMFKVIVNAASRDGGVTEVYRDLLDLVHRHHQ